MRATEFVESYFDAWNHRDSDAVAGHLAADGLYCDIPQNARRTHDELVDHLKEFFSMYRHRYELIGEILKDNNTIAFQYRMYPLGKANTDGSADSYHGAEFISIKGSTATTITDYYNMPGDVGPSGRNRTVPRIMRRHKYAKSGLSDERLLIYKERVQAVMQTQRAYLRPDLTLPKLAEAAECSVNHLSQVINAGFGMSFFDYVNRYRIDHAKALLSSLDDQGNAVLDVAFKVGFNSNSAFYTAFKKYVGITPAQFRRSQFRAAH